MTRILIVNGSLRAASHTRRLLKIIAGHLREFGSETKFLDLAETPLPMLNTDTSSEADNREAIRDMLLWADGFLLGSPDYHGSMCAPIKNFLDYFWHEFTGKLFGYVVASHEKGLTVQDQMRTAVRQCYGWSLPYGIGFYGDEDFDADGKLTSDATAARARGYARDLSVYAGLLAGQWKTDLAGEPRKPGFAEKFKI